MTFHLLSDFKYLRANTDPIYRYNYWYKGLESRALRYHILLWIRLAWAPLMSQMHTRSSLSWSPWIFTYIPPRETFLIIWHATIFAYSVMMKCFRLPPSWRFHGAASNNDRRSIEQTRNRTIMQTPFYSWMPSVHDILVTSSSALLPIRLKKPNIGKSVYRYGCFQTQRSGPFWK